MTSAVDRAPFQASARPAPVSPRRRRPKRVAFALTALVGVVTLITLMLVGLAGGSKRPVNLHFVVPSDYHVTYLVTSAGTALTTEQVWVHGPFESVDVTRGGPPPGASASLTIVNRLGAQVLQAGGAQATLLRVPAAVSSQAVRADVFVPSALRAGRLRFIRWQTVVGRRCAVLRGAGSLRSGPLPALTSSATHTDTCIDAAGLILRETTVTNDHVTTDRRAVAVSVGAASVPDPPFTLAGAPTPFDQGGGAFTALTFASRPPGGSWALLHPPAGFRWTGRYAVVPPQPQAFAGGSNGAPSAGLPSSLVTEIDDVFVRGSDAIVLQQGSSIGGATFNPPARSDAVDLGALGAGQLLYAANASTVTAEPGGGKRFIRLSGTLPPDVLVSLARSLVPQPSGTLQRVSGAGAS